MSRQIIIPGPAQALLTEALDLPDEASVPEMLQEIQRLKMAAAEGKPRSSRKAKIKKFPSPSPDDKDVA